MLFNIFNVLEKIGLNAQQRAIHVQFSNNLLNHQVFLQRIQGQHQLNEGLEAELICLSTNAHIGENLNYSNKYYSDAKNTKAWVDKFHDEAVKKGMILGNGIAIHAHGTTTELRNKMPKLFKIVLPKSFKGI